MNNLIMQLIDNSNSTQSQADMSFEWISLITHLLALHSLKTNMAYWKTATKGMGKATVAYIALIPNKAQFYRRESHVAPPSWGPV